MDWNRLLPFGATPKMESPAPAVQAYGEGAVFGSLKMSARPSFQRNQTGTACG